ncbi:MAG: type II secretion system protein GspG [Planctomycetes bacterium]|nr:type II secretion system protein GspG [Planctomycetota bacterium]
MIRSSFVVALALLVPQAVAQKTELPPDLVALVPADAAVWAQVSSIDALARELQPFFAIEAPDQPPLTGVGMLALLRGAVDLPGDIEYIDPSRPIGVAVRIARGSAVPTFIVPTRDAAKWTASVQGAAEQVSCTTAGTYVGCTLGAAPAAPAANAAPSTLLVGLPRGLVCARVDVARLTTTFKLEIDAALGQFEQMIEAGAFETEAVPFDMSEMLDTYLQFAKDFVASAERLDLVSDSRGGDLAVLLELRNKTGSPLSKYADAERVDYQALARLVDPNAALQMVGSYSQRTTLEMSSAMYESMFDMLTQQGAVPPAVIAALRALFAHAKTLAETSGRSIAASGDVGARGVELAYVLAPPKPDELVSGWSALLADPAFAALGVKRGEERKLDLGGVAAKSWDVAVDVRAAAAALDPDFTADATAFEMLEEVRRRVFGGESLRVTAARSEGKVALLVGGDEAWRAATAKRLLGASTPSPELARLVGLIEGANPGSVTRVDFGRALAGFAKLFEGTRAAEMDYDDVLSIVRKFGAKPMTLAFHWGATPASWTAGIVVGKEGALHFAKCVREQEDAQRRHVRVNEDLLTIMGGLDHYAAQNDGKFPSELKTLTILDENGAAYLDALPSDPWGRAYLYRLSPDGTQYIVNTLGADAKEGGSGENADRSSEQLQLPEQSYDEDSGGMDEDGEEEEEE